jgi:hypothetical protein
MAKPKLITEAERSTVTRIYGRREMEQAFLEAFDRVGGVDRLVAWASQQKNYKDFLWLLMKFAPKEAARENAGVVLEYRTLVPQSTLNRAVARPLIEDDIDEGDISDA